MDVMDIMECDKWHVQVQCRVVSVPLDNEMWRSIQRKCENCDTEVTDILDTPMDKLN